LLIDRQPFEYHIDEHVNGFVVIGEESILDSVGHHKGYLPKSCDKWIN